MVNTKRKYLKQNLRIFYCMISYIIHQSLLFVDLLKFFTSFQVIINYLFLFFIYDYIILLSLDENEGDVLELFYWYKVTMSHLFTSQSAESNDTT